MTRPKAMMNFFGLPWAVEALDDLMAGRIDFYFVPIPPALPLACAGQGGAARGEHDHAMAAVTRPADARGSGLSYFHVSHLVWAIGPGEYAAQNRRQAERGNWQRPRPPGDTIQSSGRRWIRSNTGNSSPTT